MKKYPPIVLWTDTGKAPPGPNDLQKLYFIDKIPPEKRPHLHTQDLVLSIGGQGSGKSVRRGTLVVMYDGSLRKIEDVIVGDLLMGPDSTPRKVLALGRGREVFYKVSPIKGDPWYCNESHILSLKYSGKNCKEFRINANGSTYIKPPRYGGQEIVNVSIKDYLQWSKRKQSRYMQYRASTITFPNPYLREFKIDPYILGLWLGDGDSHRLALTTADAELEKAFLAFAEIKKKESKVSVKKEKPTRVINIHIKESLDLLRFHNLENNKHIPFVFKTSSVRDRLHLLAGLIDTDGYLGTNCMEITQKNKTLAEDIAFVCRSLGFAAYIKEIQKSCTYKGEKKWGTYYKVSISGDLSQIPCLLKRKQATPRQQKKDHLVTGFKLERLPEDDYYGVVLDGDHLFLLGDFTVVHNTHGAVMRMIDQCRSNSNLQAYIGAKDFNVVERNIWTPFNRVFIPDGDPKNKHPFLTKAFSQNFPIAKFANGSTIHCLNLSQNMKQEKSGNIGFTTGFLLIDELHTLEEHVLDFLIGRVRDTIPQIRQVIMCTNPERSKSGWINQKFNLKEFDGVDTSERPVQKLLGPECTCQVCTKCTMAFGHEISWEFNGEDMVCPKCKAKKDFYTWQGKKYWCPGKQQYWRVIKSESHHNPHLPDDYFQSMKAMYDPTFYNIMVKGQLNANLREDYVYSDYTEENNLLDATMPIDWDLDIHWGLDFNKRPQSSVVCQMDRSINNEPRLIIKDEIIMYGPTMDDPHGGATAVHVADEFVRRYKPFYKNSTIHIYGDPKGWTNHGSDRELTRYAQIVNILEANGFIINLVANADQIPKKERIDNVNNLLKKGIIVVNPPRPVTDSYTLPDGIGCEWAAKSLAELEWVDKSTKEDVSTKGDENARKSNNRSRVYAVSHITDALGYLVYKEFNILGDMSTPQSLTVVGRTHTEAKNNGEVKSEFIEAPEATKKAESIADQLNEEHKRVELAIEAEIERINKQSFRSFLRDRGFQI